MPVPLSHLFAGVLADDLHDGVVAVFHAQRHVDADNVFHAVHRGLPYLQIAPGLGLELGPVFAVLVHVQHPPHLDGVGSHTHGLVDGLYVKDGAAGGDERLFRGGGVFLMEAVDIAGAVRQNTPAPPCQLLVGHAVVGDQFLLFFRGFKVVFGLHRIIGKAVPREEQGHKGALALNGPLPFLIEATADAVGRGLDDNDGPRHGRHGVHQGVHGLVGALGPERHLRQMQKMDGLGTAGVGIHSGFDADRRPHTRFYPPLHIIRRRVLKQHLLGVAGFDQRGQHGMALLLKHLHLVEDGRGGVGLVGHDLGLYQGAVGGSVIEHTRHGGRKADLAGFQYDYADGQARLFLAAYLTPQGQLLLVVT